ncbi:hypothetical protein L6164_027169 [Bauhinia variegata]|uniref:Uncharacterized protein n=1 Tax=Bauhinia variegata TaxID=167791 RepID=A0ACB9LTT5_BAUVA|nr:hypothetical protein L6164_027169 [Bauhinia variegata]
MGFPVSPKKPSDPYDCAIARLWVAYLDDKLFSSMRRIIFTKDEEAKKPNFEQMEEVRLRMEELLGKCSKGKGFFGGDQIGFIDIVFGSLLS